MSTERKKVLLLIPTLCVGGAERCFSMLLQHLDRDRFEPHLAVLQAKGQYLREIPEDVVIHDLKASRARRSLLKLILLIRSLRPRAVLSTLCNANIVLSLAQPLLPAGTRIILSEATSPNAAIEAQLSHPWVWKWLYRRFYKRAHKVVCLCDAIVDEMASSYGVPREKLARVYNPIDIKRARELAETGGSPFSEPGPHLVAVGRLCQAKGFDLLLAAMPAVLERMSGARLTIVGDGTLRGELAAQAQRLGLERVVSFAGFQCNPFRYLQHANVFVLSSRYEGLPYTLLEAFAVGIPVVATECSGAIREVAACYRRIVLVPPEDPGALAAGVVTACGAPRGGSEQADLSCFDLAHVVAEYSSLLWE